MLAHDSDSRDHGGQDDHGGHDDSGHDDHAPETAPLLPPTRAPARRSSSSRSLRRPVRANTATSLSSHDQAHSAHTGQSDESDDSDDDDAAEPTPVVHAAVLLVLAGLDLVVSLGLLVAYALALPHAPPASSPSQPSPPTPRDLPIDLAALSALRVAALFLFLLQFKWAIAARMPLLAVAGSTAYLFVRTASATTAVAFATLAFQFVVSWCEAAVYVHGCAVHGSGMWGKHGLLHSLLSRPSGPASVPADGDRRPDRQSDRQSARAASVAGSVSSSRGSAGSAAVGGRPRGRESDRSGGDVVITIGASESASAPGSGGLAPDAHAPLSASHAPTTKPPVGKPAPDEQHLGVSIAASDAGFASDFLVFPESPSYVELSRVPQPIPIASYASPQQASALLPASLFTGKAPDPMAVGDLALRAHRQQVLQSELLSGQSDQQHAPHTDVQPGSSAPIPIRGAISFSQQRTSPDYPQISQQHMSLHRRLGSLQHMSGASHQPRLDSAVFDGYLTRRGEAGEAMRHMWLGNYDTAMDIVRRGERWRTVPRHALVLMYCTIARHGSPGGYTAGGSSRAAVYDAVKDVVDVGLRVLAMSDRDMAAVLSGNTAMQTGSSGGGGGGGSGASSGQGLDSLFWRLWRLDVETCVSQCLMVQGLLQGRDGRHIKAAAALRKASTTLGRVSTAAQAIDLGVYGDVASSGGGSAGRAVCALQGDVVDTCDACLAGIHLAQVMMAPQAPGLKAAKHRDIMGDLRTLFLLSISDGVIAPFAASAFLACRSVLPIGIIAFAPSITTSGKPTGDNDLDSLTHQVLVEVERKWPRSVVLRCMAGLACWQSGDIQRSVAFYRSPAVGDTGNGSGWTLRIHIEDTFSDVVQGEWTRAVGSLSRLWRSMAGQADPDGRSGPPTGHRTIVGLMLCGVLAVLPTVDPVAGGYVVQGFDTAAILAECRDRLLQASQSDAADVCVQVMDALEGDDTVMPSLLLFALLYFRRDFARLAVGQHTARIDASVGLLKRMHTAMVNGGCCNQRATGLYRLVCGSLLKYQSVAMDAADSTELETSETSVSAAALRDEAYELLRACISGSRYDDQGMETRRSADNMSDTFTRRVASYAVFEMAELEAVCYKRLDRGRMYLATWLQTGRVEVLDDGGVGGDHQGGEPGEHRRLGRVRSASFGGMGTAAGSVSGTAGSRLISTSIPRPNFLRPRVSGTPGASGSFDGSVHGMRSSEVAGMGQSVSGSVSISSMFESGYGGFFEGSPTSDVYGGMLSPVPVLDGNNGGGGGGNGGIVSPTASVDEGAGGPAGGRWRGSGSGSGSAVGTGRRLVAVDEGLAAQCREALAQIDAAMKHRQ